MLNTLQTRTNYFLCLFVSEFSFPFLDLPNGALFLLSGSTVQWTTGLVFGSSVGSVCLIIDGLLLGE